MSTERYFNAIADYERANGRKPDTILIAAADFKSMARRTGLVTPISIAIDDVPAEGLEAIATGECVLLPLVETPAPDEAPELRMYPSLSATASGKKRNGRT